MLLDCHQFFFLDIIPVTKNAMPRIITPMEIIASDCILIPVIPEIVFIIIGETSMINPNRTKIPPVACISRELALIIRSNLYHVLRPMSRQKTG